MRFYATFVNYLLSVGWLETVYFGLAPGAGKMAPFKITKYQ